MDIWEHWTVYLDKCATVAVTERYAGRFFSFDDAKDLLEDTIESRHLRPRHWRRRRRRRCRLQHRALYSLHRPLVSCSSTTKSQSDGDYNKLVIVSSDSMQSTLIAHTETALATLHEMREKTGNSFCIGQIEDLSLADYSKEIQPLFNTKVLRKFFKSHYNKWIFLFLSMNYKKDICIGAGTHL
ncbi:hypothetical protein KIN20_035772 [Parelaphostrongylus tenuis]|uniref:Uncharacterized protein n=1 Tax=Parelaphostrongylus tenuis TaxID=148309 RepID=A0AAD5RCB1_PARTN|nr:hypothetical protein KIN20_035772 [Parelaphostrongylus tenuis]